MRYLKAVCVLLAVTILSFSNSIFAEEKIAVFDASTAIMASNPAQARIKSALERSDIVQHSPKGPIIAQTTNIIDDAKSRF